MIVPSRFPLFLLSGPVIPLPGSILPSFGSYTRAPEWHWAPLNSPISMSGAWVFLKSAPSRRWSFSMKRISSSTMTLIFLTELSLSSIAHSVHCELLKTFEELNSLLFHKTKQKLAWSHRTMYTFSKNPCEGALWTSYPNLYPTYHLIFGAKTFYGCYF